MGIHRLRLLVLAFLQAYFLNLVQHNGSFFFCLQLFKIRAADIRCYFVFVFVFYNQSVLKLGIKYAAPFCSDP